ncbi:MAG: VWA domain-containing protein [Candidatus Margulisiibacteriota bacterium]
MFQNPHMAALFIIVPILACIQFIRFKARVKLWGFFQHPRNWKSQIALSDSGHYFWQKVLILLALTFLILALMRPQYGEKYETIQRTGRQVYFIIDTSLSMLAEDGAPSRLDAAKYHIQQLLSKLDQDQLAIIPYASTAYTYLPLTNDISAVNLFLEDMFVGMIGSSGSNITNALKVVSQSIKNQGGDSATLIIFSDGEFSPTPQESILDALFKGMDIESIIVGLGSRQGEPIPKRTNNNTDSYKKDSAGNIVLTKRQEGELQRLAEQLNGIVIDGEVSPIVAEKIYLHLSTLETKKLESKLKITKVDRYHWFLIVALIFMILEYSVPKLKLSYFSKLFIFLLIITNSTITHAAHPGVEAYINGDYMLAKSEFEKELIKSPDKPKVKYNLGNTFYKLNEYNKAITAYNESIPDLSEDDKLAAYYNIGTAYLQQKDIKKAIEMYKEVLRRDPNHLQARQNIEWALQRPKNNDPSNQSNQNNQSNEDQPADSAQSPTSNTQEDVSRDQSENSDQQEQNITNNETVASDNIKSKTQDLTEQQIQLLVDNAEKEAREKRQRKIDKLFEESEW